MPTARTAPSAPRSCSRWCGRCGGTRRGSPTNSTPNHHAIRVLLVLLMLASLILAAEVPRAFGSAGLLVAILYVLMQLGRSIYATLSLRGHELRMVFARAGSWSAFSAVPVILGGLEHGHVRELLWAL